MEPTQNHVAVRYNNNAIVPNCLLVGQALLSQWSLCWPLGICCFGRLMAQARSGYNRLSKTHAHVGAASADAAT